jgi:hypothetical protein
MAPCGRTTRHPMCESELRVAQPKNIRGVRNRSGSCAVASADASRTGSGFIPRGPAEWASMRATSRQVQCSQFAFASSTARRHGSILTEGVNEWLGDRNEHRTDVVVQGGCERADVRDRLWPVLSCWPVAIWWAVGVECGHFLFLLGCSGCMPEFSGSWEF